ncbi:MAG: hypothetical protein K0V04_22070 [Deltaproteobacteria bacterium]|nr:hypothetical protein [Deltaproteobacteria bacterium]
MRSTLGAGLAVVMLSSGCGDGEPEPAAAAVVPSPGTARRSEPEPEPPLARPTEPGDFVGKHVLIPAGAKVQLGWAPTGSPLEVRLPRSRAERSPGTVLAATVVAQSRGKLQVKLAARADRCTANEAPIATVSIPMWVEPGALARVLGRAVTAKFDDGTSVQLRPGTVVGGAATRVEVDAAGLHLAVPIAEGDISTVYETVGAIGPSAGGGTPMGVLQGGPPLTIAGGDPVLPETAFIGNGLLLAHRRDGDRTLVTVGSRCALVEALADPSRLGGGPTPSGPANAETIAAAQSMKDQGKELGRASTKASAVFALADEHATVRRGATIWWPDGTEAGAAPDGLQFDTDPSVVDGRSCFEFAPFALPSDAEGTAATVTLCFEPAAVELRPVVMGIGSAGIVGLMAAEPGLGAWGGGGLGRLDDEAMQGLLEASPYGSFGSGGLGLHGSGRGGGGTGEGTIGLGGLGPGGRGSSAAKDTPAEPSATESPSVEPEPGEPDRALTMRDVTRHARKLESCYQQALRDAPALEGTMTVELDVAGGHVERVSASGKGFPASMIECVEDEVEGWPLRGTGSFTFNNVFKLG